jgi:nitrate/nitrite transporter NarK
MTTLDTSTDKTTEACAVDRSCTDSGCGCATPAGPEPAASTTSRKGLKAGLLAAACVVGCLAVPLALGGVAALSGALAGEAWLLVGLAVAAVVVCAGVARRRRTGKIC